MWKSLGPGLLYAGAAIGVSHLVQSTRAGADFGFSLIWVVLIANFLKYPLFEIGPRYAAITGKNLLEGYHSLGKWAVILFFLVSLASMFTVQAAVTLVTAGLAGEVFGLAWLPWQWALVLLILCASILLIGHYKFLDRLAKVIVITLTLTTLIVLIGSLLHPSAQKEAYRYAFDFENQHHLFFLIALIGWMPAPIEISVWHSMWTQAKTRQLGKALPLGETMRDFHIGYWGTTVLACCFLTLGAISIYGTGVSMPVQAGEFARQFITIYTNILGDWSYVFVAVAAFTTMFSTTLTVLDGYTRVMVPITEQLGNRKVAAVPVYNAWLIALVLGAMVIITLLARNMRTMIDFATTVSFVTAPLLGYLNYRLITSSAIPTKKGLSPFSKVIAWVGLTFITGFSLYYFVQLLLG